MEGQHHANAVDTRELAQRHLLPHFTKGAAWNSEQLGTIDRGEGCYVWDTDGNKYLDGLAGLFCTNLGHGRHDLTAAAAKQMDQLAYFPNWGWSNPATAEAAAMIAQDAPGDIDEVFFVNSGSEAVESALKFARNYHFARGDTDRYKVIARDWAYHGTTLGTLAVTGIPKFKTHFGPMMWDGVRHVRNTWGDEIPEGGTAADLDSVKAIEAKILEEGPETVALVIAEPVQNGRGAVVPPEGYWQELRRICDKYGVLLCADEVINAFGRLGHFTGSERMGVVPDMITFAKGVTSAYMPLGGVMVRRPLVEEVWESEVAMFNHGSTFGGHPVATAVAVANMRAMRDERIFAHVLEHENYFRAGLESVMHAHDCVGEVRGTGYFYAVEFCASRSQGRELSEAQHLGLRGGALGQFVRDAKIMIRPDDRGATFLAISPPLVADKQVLDDLVERVGQIAGRTQEWIDTNS
ncbi:MAG: aminotransferase class III-fold pyridoxal phosphate-dependent enzyme [Actinomycetota bacterium]